MKEIQEAQYNGHIYKLGEVWSSNKNTSTPRNTGTIIGFANGKPMIRLTEVTQFNSRSVGDEVVLDNPLWSRVKEAPEETVFLLIDHSRDYVAQGKTLEEAINLYEDEYHELDDDVTVYEAKVLKVKKEVKYVVEGKE